jgi:pimeloyl-ACP methyl ester carboxylesterase
MVAPLREHGHDAITPDLPLGDPAAGHMERIRPALAALEGVANPVVVVGHSTSSGYAALVGTELNVSLLIHLCPRLGQFSVPDGAPSPFREGFVFPRARSDGTSVWEPAVAIAALYPRLAEDVASDLAERQIAFAMPPDDFPGPVHCRVPTVVVVAAEDEVFVPEWQRLMAREALGVDSVQVPGGHFPMVEDPEGTAELFDRLVAERVAPAA